MNHNYVNAELNYVDCTRYSLDYVFSILKFIFFSQKQSILKTGIRYILRVILTQDSEKRKEKKTIEF